MKNKWTALLAAMALVLGVRFGAAGAQTTPPAAPPPQPGAAPVPSTQPLPDGWEEIDTRVVFFTTQLAGTEASLDALDKVLRQLGYKMVYRDADAARYDAGNENMDRNAGGPVPWSDFYGTTARRFYYHNTDWSTRQIQRPPQFDYIYKANAQRADQARQEVMALGRQLDALVDRKHQVENEQSALWARIAFRIIVSQSLADKALYRFDFKDKDMDPQRLEALRASCELIRRVNALVDRIQDVKVGSQAMIYGQMIQTTRAARKDWDSRVIHQPKLALDVGDIKTPLGKLTAALKRMEDAAKNVDDAYRLAKEGDRVGDLVQKQTSRGLMQASLIDYADTLLTAHNTLKQLAQDWHTEPDPAKPIETAVAPIVAVPDSEAAPISTPRPDTASPESVYLSSLAEKSYHGALTLGKNDDLVYVNKPITVKGKVAEHGLSTCPTTRGNAIVVYDLANKYLTLSGTVALNDDAAHCESPLTFRVVGDGTTLWHSRAIQQNGITDSFRVNVEGVKQLELIVDCPGGDQYCHSVWVDPMLTTLPAAPRKMANKWDDRIAELRNVYPTGLLVLNAQYISGAAVSDVTDAVQAVVSGDSLTVPACNEALPDPTPNVSRRKRFKLVIYDGQQVRTFNVDEGSTVQIGPCITAIPAVRSVGLMNLDQRLAELRKIHPTGLLILDARYGMSWGFSRIDVTDKLQRMVVNNHLAIAANTAEMGSDPAPNRNKELTVTYHDGQKIVVVTAAEGQKLDIGR